MLKFGTIFFVREDGQDGQVYPITERNVVFGSDPDEANIKIKRDTVKPVHCQLTVNEVDGQKYEVYLTNLAGDTDESVELNGTAIGAKRTHRLSTGDMIAIGDKYFRFSQSGGRKSRGSTPASPLRDRQAATAEADEKESVQKSSSMELQKSAKKSGGLGSRIPTLGGVKRRATTAVLKTTSTPKPSANRTGPKHSSSKHQKVTSSSTMVEIAEDLSLSVTPIDMTEPPLHFNSSSGTASLGDKEHSATDSKVSVDLINLETPPDERKQAHADVANEAETPEVDTQKEEVVDVVSPDVEEFERTFGRIEEPPSPKSALKPRVLGRSYREQDDDDGDEMETTTTPGGSKRKGARRSMKSGARKSLRMSTKLQVSAMDSSGDLFANAFVDSCEEGSPKEISPKKPLSPQGRRGKKLGSPDSDEDDSQTANPPMVEADSPTRSSLRSSSSTMTKKAFFGASVATPGPDTSLIKSVLKLRAGQKQKSVDTPPASASKHVVFSPHIEVTPIPKRGKGLNYRQFCEEEEKKELERLQKAEERKQKKLSKTPKKKESPPTTARRSSLRSAKKTKEKKSVSPTTETSVQQKSNKSSSPKELSLELEPEHSFEMSPMEMDSKLNSTLKSLTQSAGSPVGKSMPRLRKGLSTAAKKTGDKRRSNSMNATTSAPPLTPYASPKLKRTEPPISPSVHDTVDLLLSFADQVTGEEEIGLVGGEACALDLDRTTGSSTFSDDSLFVTPSSFSSAAQKRNVSTASTTNSNSKTAKRLSLNSSTQSSVDAERGMRKSAIEVEAELKRIETEEGTVQSFEPLTPNTQTLLEMVNAVKPIQEGKRPKISKDLSETPGPSYVGVKELLKTPRDPFSPIVGAVPILFKEQNEEEETQDFRQLRNLVKTPKESKSPRYAGVKEIFHENKETTEEGDRNYASAMKEMLKSPPQELPTPDFRGVKDMLRTPKQRKSARYAGVREMFHEPPATKHDDATEEGVGEIFKSPPGSQPKQEEEAVINRKTPRSQRRVGRPKKQITQTDKQEPDSTKTPSPKVRITRSRVKKEVDTSDKQEEPSPKKRATRAKKGAEKTSADEAPEEPSPKKRVTRAKKGAEKTTADKAPEEAILQPSKQRNTTRTRKGAQVSTAEHEAHKEVVQETVVEKENEKVAKAPKRGRRVKFESEAKGKPSPVASGRRYNTRSATAAHK